MNVLAGIRSAVKTPKIVALNEQDIGYYWIKPTPAFIEGFLDIYSIFSAMLHNLNNCRQLKAVTLIVSLMIVITYSISASIITTA
jgi:hypothetical protein